MTRRMLDETKLALRNDDADLPRLNDWVEQFGRRRGLAHDRLFEIKTCLYEAVANVIAYAYLDHHPHQIEVRLAIADGAVIATVEDDGQPFDPLAVTLRPPEQTIELAQIGGRGILMMRQFMDRMRYERRDGHNLLTLIRCLPEPS
ncbi:MAG: ATP-binding protein [Azospirillum sp.]|nr:ATP-binding protein [Azospirillum sp.]